MSILQDDGWWHRLARLWKQFDDEAEETLPFTSTTGFIVYVVRGTSMVLLFISRP